VKARWFFPRRQSSMNSKTETWCNSSCIAEIPKSACQVQEF
jgi:hypothetical protein